MKKILIISILILTLVLVNCSKNIDFKQICADECNKFDLEMYKIDEIKTYGFTSINCWCIQDGTPYSIGQIGRS